MFKHKCGPASLTWILVVAGAINWGILGFGNLIGNPDLNIVHMLFGNISVLEDVIYAAVGIAGVRLLFVGDCRCKTCNS